MSGKRERPAAEPGKEVDMTNKDKKHKEILEIIRELYPDMTCVTISVNCEEMTIDCNDRIITGDYTMKKINGDWCEKLNN